MLTTERDCAADQRIDQPGRSLGCTGRLGDGDDECGDGGLVDEQGPAADRHRGRGGEHGDDPQPQRTETEHVDDQAGHDEPDDDPPDELHGPPSTLPEGDAEETTAAIGAKTASSSASSSVARANDTVTATVICSSDHAFRRRRSTADDAEPPSPLSDMSLRDMRRSSPRHFRRWSSPSVVASLRLRVTPAAEADELARSLVASSAR